MTIGLQFATNQPKPRPAVRESARVRTKTNGLLAQQCLKSSRYRICQLVIRPGSMQHIPKHKLHEQPNSHGEIWTARPSNNGDKAIWSGSDIWIFDEDPHLWVTIWWGCRWSTSIKDGANERSCLSQDHASIRYIDFGRHICSMGAQTAIRTSISIYLYQRPKLWDQPCDYLMNVMQLRCENKRFNLCWASQSFAILIILCWLFLIFKLMILFFMKQVVVQTNCELMYQKHRILVLVLFAQ